jgi:hypothetical protein
VKTADSIAQQDERKAARGDGETLPADTQPLTQKHRRGDASYAARIAPWKWKPGQSGNSSGKRNDLAQEIARAVFENNAEALYRAFCKTANEGQRLCLQRTGRSRLREAQRIRVIEHAPLQDVPTPDLEAHIEELQTKFIASLVEQGYTVTKPPQLLPAPADKDKIQ